VVRDLQPERLVESEHARGEVREDVFEVRPGAFDCSRFASAAARASSSWPIMLLNERVRMPSSSRLVTRGRWLKSPRATASVDSASSASGSDRRRLRMNASAIAENSASSKVRVKREDVDPLEAGAQKRKLLVVAVDRLHRFGLRGDPWRDGVRELQQSRLVAIVVPRPGRPPEDEPLLAERLDRGIGPPAARLAQDRRRRGLGHEPCKLAARPAIMAPPGRPASRRRRRPAHAIG